MDIYDENMIDNVDRNQIRNILQDIYDVLDSIRRENRENTRLKGKKFLRKRSPLLLKIKQLVQNPILINYESLDIVFTHLKYFYNESTFEQKRKNKYNYIYLKKYINQLTDYLNFKNKINNNENWAKNILGNNENWIKIEKKEINTIDVTYLLEVLQQIYESLEDSKTIHFGMEQLFIDWKRKIIIQRLKNIITGKEKIDYENIVLIYNEIAWLYNNFQANEKFEKYKKTKINLNIYKYMNDLRNIINTKTKELKLGKPNHRLSSTSYKVISKIWPIDSIHLIETSNRNNSTNKKILNQSIRHIITNIYDLLEFRRKYRRDNKNLKGDGSKRSKLLKDLYDLSIYKKGKKRKINNQSLEQIYKHLENYINKTRNKKLKEKDNYIGNIVDLLKELKFKMFEVSNNKKNIQQIENQQALLDIIGVSNAPKASKKDRPQVVSKKNEQNLFNIMGLNSNVTPVASNLDRSQENINKQENSNNNAETWYNTNDEIWYNANNGKNTLSASQENFFNNEPLLGGSQFIHIPNFGKRKVRYQKNGRAYVIVNKKKLKL